MQNPGKFKKLPGFLRTNQSDEGETDRSMM